MFALLRTQVRARTAVWAIGLLTLLSATLVAGWQGERIGLPRVERQLNLAVDDAGELLTCMQGVQDEIYLPGEAPLETRAALGAARRRLAGCDVSLIRRRLELIDLPPAAPIGRTELREAHGALEDALASLDRLVTEAEGTVDAMASELRVGDSLDDVVLGYRAGEAQYERAVQALSLASVRLNAAG